MKNNKLISSLKKTDERGRTMVEMLGVLAIMGLITYAAIAVINQGITSYKITQTYNEIQEIAQGVEDLYSWSEDYAGITMLSLCKNDIFPGGCIDDNSSGIGQFGQGISVSICDETLCGVNSRLLFAIKYPIGADDETYTRLHSLNWCEGGLHAKNLKNDGNFIVVRPLINGETLTPTCAD